MGSLGNAMSVGVWKAGLSVSGIERKRIEPMNWEAGSEGRGDERW